MAARDDYLIDTLAEMGVVTDEELAIAQDESMSSGEGVVDTLIAKVREVADLDEEPEVEEAFEVAHQSQQQSKRSASNMSARSNAPSDRMGETSSKAD